MPSVKMRKTTIKGMKDNASTFTIAANNSNPNITKNTRKPQTVYSTCKTCVKTNNFAKEANLEPMQQTYKST